MQCIEVADFGFVNRDLPSSGKYGAGCQAYFYIDRAGDFLPLAVKPIVKGSYAPEGFQIGISRCFDSISPRLRPSAFIPGTYYTTTLRHGPIARSYRSCALMTDDEDIEEGDESDER